ncbi:alkaline proteinase [Jimgerdemannia flammicorona]|uniref:Alkaline proteinase n=1 Tax=Jimgerdemannia flammicorona TaxID=994334 RepID=A0A433DKJ9_9FUNG|nr:alkaline proteinase [Jimgerdemannia flammicorona]
MKVVSIVAVVALFVAANAAPAKEIGTLNTIHVEVVPGEWIIKLRRGGNYTRVQDLVKGHGGRRGNKLRKTWSGFSGFAGKFDEESIREIQNFDDVEFVEPEQKYTILATQTPVPSWGLARVSSHTRQTKTYTYPDSAGAGITAYVIDTGVLATHTDFGGRARLAVNFVDNQNTDCNGHGTHVSGTIAGTKYGIAKKAKIVGVKVLNCKGSGTTSGVISGVEWVTKNAIKGKSVVNMSLGGGVSQALDSAVAAAVAAGIPFFVAAGNEQQDACKVSPARTPSAFTVGATTSTDSKASYSNYGTCVDIWAPGSSITSAWIGSNSATNIISGTSMATPHAAGVGALFLGAGTSAAALYNKLNSVASKGYVVGTLGGAPNNLLYNQNH